MKKSAKYKIDWLTLILTVIAGTFIFLIIYKFFIYKIPLPEPDRKIENWEKLTIDTPNIGNTESLVKIIEFYTYGCGHCRIMTNRFQNLVQDYPNELSIYYKPIHLNKFGKDFDSAVIAQCAELQNKFYKVHKLLFNEHLELTQIIKQSNLIKKHNFKTCIENQSTYNLVERSTLS